MVSRFRKSKRRRRRLDRIVRDTHSADNVVVEATDPKYALAQANIQQTQKLVETYTLAIFRTERLTLTGAAILSAFALSQLGKDLVPQLLLSGLPLALVVFGMFRSITLSLLVKDLEALGYELQEAVYGDSVPTAKVVLGDRYNRTPRRIAIITALMWFIVVAACVILIWKTI